MMTNKALRLHRYGGIDSVEIDEIAEPTPLVGQILVEVMAAGINPLDWKIRDGLMRDDMQLVLPAVLGLELSGRVLDANGHETLRPGDRVMGPMGGVGAYVHLVALKAENLCRKPDFLNDGTAAGAPVAIQTAHQVVAGMGDIDGRRLLIHGAGGSVGHYAVQMAAHGGATVYATASLAAIDRIRQLGAWTVIDYRNERFEDRVQDIDGVIDLVGGDVLDRSWSIVRRGGMILSTVVPDIANRAPSHAKGRFLNMRCDGDELARLVDDLVAGRLEALRPESYALEALPEAIERNARGLSPGKMAVCIGAD